ncbi:ATP-binding protein [Polaromonas sp. A23]|uniref:ATP-binding protein n=1 Tax=Polaromonas sp. A23 TaxID=1944133 RepID=UPI0009867694|nr:ATP-binding protein [Polaromonas sp. A23]OOG46635.1 hypothetical protein B0B52_03120 [Polaromonas sp. A23]
MKPLFLSVNMPQPAWCSLGSWGLLRGLTMGRQIASADAEVVHVVRDNGEGFDMAHADKLFRSFQRLHAPQDFSGAGAGLANIQRIIARHGGQIWAESARNQGASFFFMLGIPSP